MTMKSSIIALAFSILSFNGWTSIEDESRYQFYLQKLDSQTSQSHFFLSEKDIKIYLDLLYDLSQEGHPESQTLGAATLRELVRWDLNPKLRYWLYVVMDELGTLGLEERKKIREIEQLILTRQADPELVSLYIRYPLKGGLQLKAQDLKNLYPQIAESWQKVNMGFYPQDRPRLQDLFDFDHVPAGFRGGRFESVPRLFVFCRHDRRYHCLMMMRDKDGEVVRDSRGRMWSLPVLALARQGKRYDERGGYTPSGVYTIDSVMPEADQQRTFGKYRRLIMNFIPQSPGENLLKEFLPESSQQYSWWRESVIARDIGRNLLRIHGAGYKNYNIFSRHYPFVKTIGCIGTREGRYGRNDYHDQRILLDTMMVASGLEPRYENESKLYALLYVVEINNIKSHVTLDEMIWYLQRN